MPHEPSHPQTWLARAKSNLALAQVKPSADIFLEDLGYNAQQAAEKALKALCISRGIAFPKTHNLGLLLDLLQQQGEFLPSEVLRAVELTPFATALRYPGANPPITYDDYLDAIEVARGIVEWVEAHL
ncbi:MAG: DNA-binding protein [Meiothermus sp.]|uniref:DNA-binding protein n=2 Tax=Meiothermus hypogaeus TaxID=884155 RepID=A0A511R423_9DEIN|nr:HEPN domain-containing protein [Meiothermus hypogaeus]RIH74329.1 HEPN domain protein [Meiothermus hypogaeus]GEM84361.1 DNA-binding protein [Meiothermus hypogaeus NBRC 106114]GIW38093.1 MAG: DNA-binding protein [Meiothermus sp.]